MARIKKSEIFGTLNEKFVNGIVLYYNSTDSILYYNKNNTTYTNKVSKADLVNLFKKGLVIVDNGSAFVRPTTLTVSDNYAAVSYITVGTSDIAVLTSFYSDGYTAG